MKNHIPAAVSVAVSTLRSSSAFRKITLAAALLATGFVFSVAGVSHGDVRFSKPVVMLKGTVHSAETGKVQSVKVSIRSIKDKDEEITSSVSNSISGNYLVILASNTKYLVRLQTAAGVIKEETIQTPRLNDATIQINKDFTIKTTSSKEDMGNLTK